jgi:PKD repeat protein
MRKSLVFLMAVAMCWSCSKDEVTPPVADFSVTVVGQAPSATLQLVNKSTGTSSFSWTFGTGSSIATSTDKEPANVKVDKAGDLEITLVAGSGSSTNTKTVKVAVSGNNAIQSYSDVEFALAAGNATYGRFFSFDAGKIYKDSEINATVGPTIHLAFSSMGNTLYYFSNATDASYKVPGATVTKVTNYFSTKPISTTEFDAMVDDTKLIPLTIVESNDSFGNAYASGGIVLFQLASGKKGVIKTKAVNSQRLLVDIKIQKY